jgi:hypothetical protein
MSQTELSLDFRIEFAVAATVLVAIVVMSLVTNKARYCDVAPWHVHVGAAIYGALFGAVIGFVIVPLRALVTDLSLPPHIALVGGLSFLAIMIALRSGVIMHLPFLGPQVKAWRRATLRRTIETANKQLDRLGEPPADKS